VVRDILLYPVIPTATRPITVATLIVVSALVGASFWASAQLQALMRRRLFPRLHLDAGIEFSTLRFAHYAVISLGLLVGLKVLSVDLTGLAVVAGILSVGIGFGLQNVASNFISGVILLIERPITVGDHVTVGDTDGEVRAINMRSTEIVTRDNITVIVPNSEFVSGRVVNWSHGDPRMRIHVAVGVSYTSDAALVTRVLEELAGQVEFVLADPAPEVRFVRFGESSLNFELLVWIGNPHHQDPVSSGLHYAIRAAFLEAGIAIPFPQREVTVHAAESQRDAARN
jgi:small-conductance mechanosensitive channel